MINDFILLHNYGQSDDTKEPFRYELLRLMIAQIGSLYPKATVHVITNRPMKDGGQVKCHQCNSTGRKHDYSQKFLAYSLLDRPAMYLDTDVLLIKPFTAEHLETKNAFRPYFNLKNYNGRPYWHYMSGVVWIKEPSKWLEDCLRAASKSANRGSPVINDEIAISAYIAYCGWKIPETTDVAVPQNMVKGNLMNCQSVHYMARKWDALIPDLKMYRPEIFT